MPLAGLALVLTAAICHATWNLFVKRLNAGPELIWLFSLVSAAIYGPVALWIILVERPAIGGGDILFIAGSVALHLGYLLVLQTGYRKGDLSLVYPTARATGPLLSTTLAVLFLGETVTAQMALGAVIVVGGVLMLTGGVGPRGRHVATSLAFGLATGLLIGSYTAWDAYTVAVLAIPPLLLEYASIAGRVALLAPVARARRDDVRRLWQTHKHAIFAVALFNPLAYILVLYALTFTPVSYVAPVREVSVLLSVLAGSLILGEGQLGRRLCWATVILLGIALLVTARTG